MVIDRVLFDDVDIIECNNGKVFDFIKSLIEFNIIKCNILILKDKFKFYYNGKRYYNKVKWFYNNATYDYLRDSNGNQLFWCDDKYDNYDNTTCWFLPIKLFDHDDLIINEGDLIITYINENE